MLISSEVSTILWGVLIFIDVLISTQLGLLYRKDGDRRKIMFIIGLLTCSLAYWIAIIGVRSTPTATRIFEWCSLPILSAFCFVILSDLKGEKDISRYCNVFIIICIATFVLFLVPSPFYAFTVLEVGMAFTLIIAAYQCYKTFNLSTVMMMLSIPSFTVCLLGLQNNITELALFSGFAAKAFLILTFEATKYQEATTSSVFQVENQLNVMEENFYRLFSMLPDPAVIIDTQGNFLDVTNSVTNVTGFTREDLVGTNFIDSKFTTSESKVTLMRNLRTRVMGQQVDPYEIEIINKEGKVYSFEVNASKIEFKGKPAVVVDFHDSTEKKRYLNDLKHKEERFRDIAENVGDWVWEVDQNGKYLYSNSGCQKILGFAVEEILNIGFDDLIISDQGQKYFFSRYLEKDHADVLIKKCISKTGKTVLLESKGIPVVVNGAVVGYRGIDRLVHEINSLKDSQGKNRKLASLI